MTTESKEVENEKTGSGLLQHCVMHEARIRIGLFRIDFDRNYGCNNRTGWSIAHKGSFLVQLEKYLTIAIIKAIRA
jgi:hypothetical protein